MQAEMQRRCSARHLQAAPVAAVLKAVSVRPEALQHAGEHLPPCGRPIEAPATRYDSLRRAHGPANIPPAAVQSVLQSMPSAGTLANEQALLNKVAACLPCGDPGRLTLARRRRLPGHRMCLL